MKSFEEEEKMPKCWKNYELWKWWVDEKVLKVSLFLHMMSEACYSTSSRNDMKLVDKGVLHCTQFPNSENIRPSFLLVDKGFAVKKYIYWSHHGTNLYLPLRYHIRVLSQQLPTFMFLYRDRGCCERFFSSFYHNIIDDIATL